MRRWRRENIILSIAYLIVGSLLTPFVPGNHLLWHVLMLAGALFGFATSFLASEWLGKISATAMIAGAVIRAFSFIIYVSDIESMLSWEQKLSYATFWLLIAYEIGSVWVRVIIPGIKLHHLEVELYRKQSEIDRIEAAKRGKFRTY